MQDLMVEHLESIFLFAFLSIASFWIARTMGYFYWPKEHTPPREALPLINFFQVVAVFAIYLISLLFLGNIFAYVFDFVAPIFVTREFLYSPSYPPVLSSIVQVVTTLVAAYLLYLFCKKQKDRKNMLAIWKHPHSHSSIAKDIGYGVITWAVSFPFVLLASELFDFLIYLFSGPQEYEQVAVQYLKMSIGSNILFIIAIFTILVAAPVLEELLFRGFLLNFLRRYLGRVAAIILSALAFALFHFSMSQSLGNFPLVGSLFTLALFLGYIYERQGSLFASIALHMTFNIISTIRILTGA
jgi:membrane protease YdiL (CAAX protease family)